MTGNISGSNGFQTCLRHLAFNHRLRELAPAFERLLDSLGQSAQRQLVPTDDRVIDSLPVIVARRGSRSTTARVARQVADKSFCASKILWSHGVNIHLAAARR